MISRRSFLQLLGASIGTTVLTPSASAVTQATRPNIIFFLVDDMGWQDTSLAFYYRNGKAVRTRLNNRYQTPNMETMAAEGMLFTDAYATAVCSPTRCSIMSGMNAARHRVTDWTLEINTRSGYKASEEGVTAPNWAMNGIQPAGTPAVGSCPPPFKLDANKKYYQPALDSTEDAIAYEMTTPFTTIKALPEFLREQGYLTIHCGKAHFGSSSYLRLSNSGQPTPGADPRRFGFDINIAGCETGAPGSYRGGTGHHYGENDRAEKWCTPGLDENNYYEDDVFLTDALTDMSLKAVEQHLEEKPTQPFYLYLAHYAVHDPFANNYAWDHSRSTSTTVSQDTKNPNPNDGLSWNETERNYSVLLKGMDDSLGQVLQFVKDKGIDDNTLIVFMSDNGGLAKTDAGRMANANAPLKAGKGSCYEGGIREPMIVRWPGKVAAGTLSQEPVIIEDFFSTFLDVAGLDPQHLTGLATTPAGIFDDGPLQQVIDGESFLPVLLGQRKTVRADGAVRPLVWHLPNRWTGANNKLYDFYSVVRLGDWKLIYQHSDQSFELYHLPTDISETKNLAAKCPERVNYLRKVLADTLRARGAQRPTVNSTGQLLPWPDDATLTQGGLQLTGSVK